MKLYRTRDGHAVISYFHFFFCTRVPVYFVLLVLPVQNVPTTPRQLGGQGNVLFEYLSMTMRDLLSKGKKKSVPSTNRPCQDPKKAILEEIQTENVQEVLVPLAHSAVGTMPLAQCPWHIYLYISCFTIAANFCFVSKRLFLVLQQFSIFLKQFH